jgi:hypothetical protein
MERMVRYWDLKKQWLAHLLLCYNVNPHVHIVKPNDHRFQDLAVWQVRQVTQDDPPC